MSEIHLIKLLLIAIFIACAAAFGILFIGKVGIREAVITAAPKLISKLFECDFCLSFWTSLILAIILAISFSNMSILLTPIISTPITRVLI